MCPLPGLQRTLAQGEAQCPVVTPILLSGFRVWGLAVLGCSYTYFLPFLYFTPKPKTRNPETYTSSSYVVEEDPCPEPKPEAPQPKPESLRVKGLGFRVEGLGKV